MSNSLERANVALTATNSAALTNLVQHTGHNKTDVINRALGLYWFIESEIKNGGRLAFIQPNGDVLPCHIIG